MSHIHNFIGLDLETGGFDPLKNPIITSACIAVDHNFKELERFTTFIQNQRNLEITPSATKVHGIHPSDVRIMNGLTIDEFYKKLVEFFKKFKSGKYNLPIIIGHNVAKFDILLFLQKYIFEPKNDTIFNYVEGFVYDTQYMCRIKYMGKEMEGLGGFTLTECCEREGIETSDNHDAINDVEVNLKLAEILIKEQQNPGSIEGEFLEEEKNLGIRGRFFI